MNLSTVSQIAFSTLIASVSSLAIAPSASAIMWSVSGTFDDGGTLTGTFVFNETEETYSNVNIVTTVGTTLSGSTYSDELSVFGNATGFSVDDDLPNFTLTLDFTSSLSSSSGAISLNTTTTQEEDFDFNVRTLNSGTVSASVPFEFHPTLGILLLGGVWGISYVIQTQIEVK